MNSTSWRHYYELNRMNRIEPDWAAPCKLPVDLQRHLAISLSHFQLGESGGGSNLLRGASKASDPDDLVALELFVREEREHARLLAGMVRRVGGSLIDRHWTHGAFRLVRRAGGFQFEIQVLLTAEIVGTAYYELVKAVVDDPALQAALGLMLKDEAGHVAFHLDRLRIKWSEYLPMERAVWAFQFQLLLLVAMRAAWLDHGACLRALGHTWDDFSQHARKVAIQFLDGLEAQNATCRGCVPVKATAEQAA
jgi:hypothetical protein